MAQVMEPTNDDSTTPALPPLTPQELAPHFPQLEILECLGRGGMGVVYKARQRSLNRVVALKLLAPERADDPEFATRFVKEAHALAALNHPNIVGVYDFGNVVQSSGRQPLYYLLMEFVDGTNLRHLLQAQHLSPEEALRIVPPLCDALQSAHDCGIVHCDIKPENLLIDKNGVVKIADFGIAKMYSSPIAPAHVDTQDQRSPNSPCSIESPPLISRSEMATMGTPQYAAPEQSNGTADHRADIYSLGVVLYELLTGERPGHPAVPPSKRTPMDLRLDGIVLKALEEQPDHRYTTASEFGRQLEEVTSNNSAASNLTRFTDDPKNWYLWFIYFCREDPRIAVPKRIAGLGWTLNFAHPWAVPFFTLLCLGVWAVFEVLKATGSYRQYGTWTMLALLLAIVLLFQNLSNPNRPSKS